MLRTKASASIDEWKSGWSKPLFTDSARRTLRIYRNEPDDSDRIREWLEVSFWSARCPGSGRSTRCFFDGRFAQSSATTLVNHGTLQEPVIRSRSKRASAFDRRDGSQAAEPGYFDANTILLGTLIIWQPKLHPLHSGPFGQPLQIRPRPIHVVTFHHNFFVPSAPVCYGCHRAHSLASKGHKMADRENSPGFWQTAPGVLTAIAAVITALGGVFVTLKTLQSTPNLPASSASGNAVLPSSQPKLGPPQQPNVYSSGTLVVRGTWSYDLDAGTQTTDQAHADFFWEQVTPVRRLLVPKSGAQFDVVGIRDFKSVRYADLKRFSYSPDQIDGSDMPSNRIPQGTVVAYRTKAGRLGKFVVEQYGYNLSIEWVTFANQ